MLTGKPSSRPSRPKTRRPLKDPSKATVIHGPKLVGSSKTRRNFSEYNYDMMLIDQGWKSSGIPTGLFKRNFETEASNSSQNQLRRPTRISGNIGIPTVSHTLSISPLIGHKVGIKPTFSKPPFGSFLPREFKWQANAPAYNKDHNIKYQPMKPRVNPNSQTVNKSPFALPGESRSQELMRVGKLICDIPYRHKKHFLGSPKDLRRKVLRHLEGDKEFWMREAREYLQELDDLEKRLALPYEDTSVMPRLNTDLIENCLKQGVDFGFRRLDSDTHLPPGVYRQYYGKQDFYDEEIIIVEPLNKTEIQELMALPQKVRQELLGKDANIGEDMKENAIMLPIVMKDRHDGALLDDQEREVSDTVDRITRACNRFGAGILAIKHKENETQ